MNEIDFTSMDFLLTIIAILAAMIIGELLRSKIRTWLDNRRK